MYTITTFTSIKFRGYEFRGGTIPPLFNIFVLNKYLIFNTGHFILFESHGEVIIMNAMGIHSVCVVCRWRTKLSVIECDCEYIQ
jgi:hypothetical protein